MIKYFILLIILSPWGFGANAQFDKSGGKEKKAKVSRPKVKKPKVTGSDRKRFKEALLSKADNEVIPAAANILGKDPNDLKTLNALAVFHLEKKRRGLATTILNRALESHPKEPALYNNLGIVLLTEGDQREAIKVFRQALGLDSRYRLALANLGSIYAEFRDHKKAREALGSGIDAVSSDLRRGDTVAAQVANNYALALTGSGEAKKAARIFEKIVEGGSRDPNVYLNYAILLNDVLKDGDKALRMLSKVRFMTEDRRIIDKADELEKRVEI